MEEPLLGNCCQAEALSESGMFQQKPFALSHCLSMRCEIDGGPAGPVLDDETGMRGAD